MSKPMLLADFVRLPPTVRGDVVEGLAAAIDTVAERGPQSHRFLRFGWYAAALAAYGGQARTLVVAEDDAPVLALPFVPFGPRILRMAAIPGCDWPFRSFGLALGATEAALKTALATLSEHIWGLRVGPIHDTDAAASALFETARAQGWATLDRRIGDSWSLDLHPIVDGQPWACTPTQQNNRSHEQHLAAQGVSEWRSLSGKDWPGGFADLGAIERTSGIARDTDRTGMRFKTGVPLAFWKAAVADPVLAEMFRAALLTVDGTPAAVSFDIDTGELLYAITDSDDPHFAKHSPGRPLYWRNLIAARGCGARRVVWGAGDSGYEHVLGAQIDAPIRDWILLKPGLPALAGRLFGWLWRRSGHRAPS